MLVLTRKSEQKIIIGKDIVITILKVQGDQVSIGIKAPRKTPIYRQELLEEIEAENALGGVASPESLDIKAMAKKMDLKKHKSKQKLSLETDSEASESKDQTTPSPA